MKPEPETPTVADNVPALEGVVRDYARWRTEQRKRRYAELVRLGAAQRLSEDQIRELAELVEQLNPPTFLTHCEEARELLRLETDWNATGADALKKASAALDKTRAEVTKIETAYRDFAIKERNEAGDPDSPDAANDANATARRRFRAPLETAREKADAAEKEHARLFAIGQRIATLRARVARPLP